MGAAMNERPVDGQNRDRLRRNGANPSPCTTEISAGADRVSSKNRDIIPAGCRIDNAKQPPGATRGTSAISTKFVVVIFFYLCYNTCVRNFSTKEGPVCCCTVIGH